LISNLRPISLSNCDIKIITKVLTKRFNIFLPVTLNPHQTAYIKGKQVHDNLRLIELVRNECSKQNINGYLVSLDAKKAFDSVDHMFIERVLDKFGVQQDFIQIFRLLYHKLTSRVLLNGFFTKEFTLGRSVKQGDALSCSLFIMCMETIINYIEQSSMVCRIPNDNCYLPKVFAFADDVAILTTDESSINNALKLYNDYTKFVSEMYPTMVNINLDNAKEIIEEFNKDLSSKSTTIRLAYNVGFSADVKSFIDWYIKFYEYVTKNRQYSTINYIEYLPSELWFNIKHMFCICDNNFSLSMFMECNPSTLRDAINSLDIYC
jgi:hypothetical protein